MTLVQTSIDSPFRDGLHHSYFGSSEPKGCVDALPLLHPHWRQLETHSRGACFASLCTGGAGELTPARDGALGAAFEGDGSPEGVEEPLNEVISSLQGPPGAPNPRREASARPTAAPPPGQVNALSGEPLSPPSRLLIGQNDKHHPLLSTPPY